MGQQAELAEIIAWSLAGEGAILGLRWGYLSVRGYIAIRSAQIINRTAELTVANNVVRGARSGSTVANRIGQQMHAAYKAGLDDGITKFKEFVLPSGNRIDFLDIQNGIIYELKPNNIRKIREGLQQLAKYKEELESLPQFKNIKWTTVLDKY